MNQQNQLDKITPTNTIEEHKQSKLPNLESATLITLTKIRT